MRHRVRNLVRFEHFIDSKLHEQFENHAACVQIKIQNSNRVTKIKYYQRVRNQCTNKK